VVTGITRAGRSSQLGRNPATASDDRQHGSDDGSKAAAVLMTTAGVWRGEREGEVMATFSGSGDLQGAEFVDANLRGARFRRADLSGVVMRAVDVRRADIDAPWLFDGESFLLVNGVDVIPLVEADLNRRFPGRAGRRATDPDGLRAAWAALERTWAATLERVAAMPAGTADVSVRGEWSFAQTLRHLVMATDTWLGRAILGIEQPFHAIGQPNLEYQTDGNDMSIFATATPPYPDVLEVRAGRVGMVRDFLATVTSDDLAATRKNPWAPEYPETILSCLHVILREEWEHHRYAVRDLDGIDATSDA
jgi:DinB superfamily/Pentapeptide repeats (8 copies)